MAALMLVAFALGGGAGYWLGVRHRAAARPPPQTLKLNVTDGGIYRVRKVVDGDTVMLENGLHVRYHGINAPEAGRFVKDAAPLAAEATARNIALVEGKRVRLRLAREPLDLHGRIVARVLVVPENGSAAVGGTLSPAAEETDACAVLVKEGLAKAMGLGMAAEEYQAMKALENEAKAAKAGIWGLDPAAAAQKPYCAADKTKIYHLATCTVARHIAPANLHQYDTAGEAEAAGLKPCGKCLAK